MIQMPDLCLMLRATDFHLIWIWSANNFSFQEMIVYTSGAAGAGLGGYMPLWQGFLLPQLEGRDNSAYHNSTINATKSALLPVLSSIWLQMEQFWKVRATHALGICIGTCMTSPGSGATGPGDVIGIHISDPILNEKKLLVRLEKYWSW